MCWCLVPDAAWAQRFIPDCAGSPTISRTRVERIAPNGDLILPGGHVVVLEGVRLPDGGLRRQALALLQMLVQQTPVTFASTQPRRDRYGRLRAQGFSGVWFQTGLLEKGLALVAISPDRDECFPELYEAEAEGRARRAGLWAKDAFLPRPALAVKRAGNFQLVEGRVADIRLADGRMILTFEGAQNLSALVAAQDRRAFRDFDLTSLEGRRVRVRGFVQRAGSRFEIALSNPAQIEMLN